MGKKQTQATWYEEEPPKKSADEKQALEDICFEFAFAVAHQMKSLSEKYDREMVIQTCGDIISLIMLYMKDKTFQ